jgi:hypothetical protein
LHFPFLKNLLANSSAVRKAPLGSAGGAIVNFGSRHAFNTRQTKTSEAIIFSLPIVYQAHHRTFNHRNTATSVKE